MTRGGVNVRGLVRTMLRAHPTARPGEISDQIIDRLDAQGLHDALVVALPYLVRDEVRKVRDEALRGPKTPGARLRLQEPRPASGEPEPERGSEPAGEGDAGPAVVAPADRERARASAEQRRLTARRGGQATVERRDREQAILRTPFTINGIRRTLGDCTPADLRWLAGEYRSQATARVSRADGFERLAARLERDGAATVREWNGRPAGELTAA